VEILLLVGARVLIPDEPTKVLAPQECDGLFRTITLGEMRLAGVRRGSESNVQAKVPLCQ
jgi:ABC-type uncharacterized transport system ATPase subunit